MLSLGGANIGFVVLSGIFIIPLFVFWIISLVQARRRNDPARVGVAWLKAVFPLWILALVLYVTYGTFNVLLYYGYPTTVREARQIGQAIDHVWFTAELFHRVSSIALFITFVEIASGYIICLNGPNAPNSGRKFARGAMFAWAFVLLVFVITQFGLGQALGARYAEDRDYPSSLTYFRDLLTVNRFAGAFVILTWLTTMPILGYGATIVHKTRTHPLLRSGAILLLVCIILDFLRHLISMAIFIDYILIRLDRFGFVTGGNRDIAIWFIVKPFFDYNLMFVILIMLFSLAIRKRNGFWSQPRPEWDYPAPQVMVIPAPYVMSVPAMPPQTYQPQLFPPGHGIPTIPQPVQQGQYPAPQGYYYQSQPPQELQQPPQQQQQQQQQQEPQQEPKQIEPLVQQQEQQQQEK